VKRIPQRKSKIDFPPEIWALPPGHLLVNGYAGRFTARFETIGDLLAGLEGYNKRLPPYAKAARHEIELALTGLSRAIERSGLCGWDYFRESRPNVVQSGSIYFFSPSLGRVSPAIKRAPLTGLHLSIRAINALRHRGIQTVGDLIDRARCGIARPADCGALTSTEIIDALNGFSKSTQRDGSVDWIGYAKRRGFSILPERKRSSWSAKDFVQRLPDIAKKAVQIRYGANDVVVLKARLLRPLSQKLSLARVGASLSRTGERARLVEEEIVRMLRGIVLEDDYHGCRFRIRSEFLGPIRTLAREFPTVCSRVFTLSQWEQRLTDLWGMRPNELGGAERLVLEILGYRKLTLRNSPIASLVLPRTKKTKVLRAAIKQTEHLLTWNYPKGLTLLDLATALDRSVGLQTDKEAELLAVIKSVPGLEKVNGRYRAKISRLIRTSDKCERVLYEKGKAMRFRDIAAQVNKDRARSDARYARDVSQLLAYDDRFIPIGKTGLWSLAEWDHIETRTIVNIAAEFLGRSNMPLHEDELFRLISARRPLKKDSVCSLLSEDHRFRRTAPRTWELVRDSSRVKPTKRDLS
jgi:hypothetical protein